MKTKLLIYSIRIAVLVGLVMFMLSLGGCRTTKQSSKTNLDIKTAANLDVKTNTESKQAAEAKVVATDKGVTTNNTATKMTITDFSAPDATGKQHPTRQTVIEQTTNNKKVADSKVNTASKSSASNKTKKADNSDYKSDVTAKADNKETKETKTPGWVYILVLVSSLGILGLIYLALKRFNIVK